MWWISLSHWKAKRHLYQRKPKHKGLALLEINTSVQRNCQQLSSKDINGFQLEKSLIFLSSRYVSCMMFKENNFSTRLAKKIINNNIFRFYKKGFCCDILWNFNMTILRCKEFAPCEKGSIQQNYSSYYVHLHHSFFIYIFFRRKKEHLLTRRKNVLGKKPFCNRWFKSLLR